LTDRGGPCPPIGGGRRHPANPAIGGSAGRHFPGIVNDIAPAYARPFLAPVRRLLLTPTEGAQATLHLATAPELAEVTGRYFIRDREARSPEMSYDPQLQQRIWDLSTTYATAPTTNHNA